MTVGRYMMRAHLPSHLEGVDYLAVEITKDDLVAIRMAMRFLDTFKQTMGTGYDDSPYMGVGNPLILAIEFLPDELEEILTEERARELECSNGAVVRLTDVEWDMLKKSEDTQGRCLIWNRWEVFDGGKVHPRATLEYSGVPVESSFDIKDLITEQLELHGV